MSDAPKPLQQPAPLQKLVAEPEAFEFDAALRVLLHWAGIADLAEAVRFVSRPGLAYAPADVLEVRAEGERATRAEGERPTVTLGLLGLTGAAGVLPRHYSELVTHDTGSALHAFLDLLAHRMLANFGEAGMKYRLDRSVEAVRLAGGAGRAAHAEALLAMTGFAEPGVTGRLPFGAEPLLHYAGLFVLRPRSAERLAALASDWLGRRVEVIEFTGAWLPISPDQRTRLPVGRDGGTCCRLGRDPMQGDAPADDLAAVGTRAWDQQARVVLRIGPLDLPSFEALLPNQPALVAFVALVRAYLGFEVGFTVNLVLTEDAVPPARLDAAGRPGPLLSWNTWLGRAGGYVARGDADEARFAAETVEGEAEIGAVRG